MNFLQQAAVAEPWFVVETDDVATPHRQPLGSLIEANQDDEDLCEKLRAAALHEVITVGAAPLFTVRRVL